MLVGLNSLSGIVNLIHKKLLLTWARGSRKNSVNRTRLGTMYLLMWGCRGMHSYKRWKMELLIELPSACLRAYIDHVYVQLFTLTRCK